MKADLFKHFTSDGHNVFLKDCTITLIDKIYGADPTRRKKYWRRVLKTLCVEYCFFEVPYSCLTFIHFSEARVLLT